MLINYLQPAVKKNAKRLTAKSGGGGAKNFPWTIQGGFARKVCLFQAFRWWTIHNDDF